MARNEDITITADSRFLADIDALGRITGLRERGDILAQSCGFTSGVLAKMAEGYVLRPYHQSMRQDWFDATINPAFLYFNMKRADTDASRPSLSFAFSAAAGRDLTAVAAALGAMSHDDALRFSVALSLCVAGELRKGGGVIRLAYVDQQGRRPFILTDTPYDRSLRNEFSRLLLEFSARLKPNGPRGPKPPGA